VGNIATTWVGKGQTLTVSSGGAAISTVVLPVGDFLSAAFNGDSTTTSGVTQTKSSAMGKATGSTTTSGKASGTISGPASTSSKPSKAPVGISFSKASAAVVVGLALFAALL
jgi:hypothetical protein